MAPFSPGPSGVFVLVTQPDLLQILFFTELNPASVACNYVALPFRESVLILSGSLLVTEGGKKMAVHRRESKHTGMPHGTSAGENITEEVTGKVEVEGIPQVRW